MAKGAAAKKGAGGVVISEAKKAARKMLEEATAGKPIKKVPEEATGITQGYREFLDDENALNEYKRRMKAESQPTPVGGKPPPPVDFPEKYVPAKQWKGMSQRKRGGGVEIGKVGGSKSKRRMDKKAR